MSQSGKHIDWILDHGASAFSTKTVFCDTARQTPKSAADSRRDRNVSAGLRPHAVHGKAAHPYDALRGDPSVGEQHSTITRRKVNVFAGQVTVAVLLLFALVSIGFSVAERAAGLTSSRGRIAGAWAATPSGVAPAQREAAALLHSPRPALPVSDWPTIGELRPLYDAICQRETRGGLDKRDGDGGESRGPYQIQRGHWTDSGIDLPYERFCRNKMVCEIEMYGYWLRHCPRALRERDFETLAKFHNGGPEHWRSQDAANYWRDVKWLLVIDGENAK